MTAIDYPPFDGDGVAIYPHRPSLDNLGGNTKVDDQDYPPSSEEPSADEHNRFAECIALAMACIPTVMMTVTFSSGAPIYAKFWAANSNLTSADFPLTDNGAGDTTISWAANIIPPTRTDPMPGLNENSNATTISAVLDESLRTIRVRTLDESAGSGVDTRFTLHIY